MKDIVNKKVCFAATAFAAWCFIATNTVAAGISYNYDSLNRLTNVDYGNGSVISYTYDAAGNRLTYSGSIQNGSTNLTHIVFADDFSGNFIDSTKWTTSGSTVIET
jgi:YD repeat-containing protein